MKKIHYDIIKHRGFTISCNTKRTKKYITHEPEEVTCKKCLYYLKCPVCGKLRRYLRFETAWLHNFECKKKGLERLRR